jgi:hypothetical protein
MGRQHVRAGVLHIRQQKTNLTTRFDRPFTAACFGNWFREQCDAAGSIIVAPMASARPAARRLAECGCTEHEISAITGHASLREVARYTRAAEQKQLARAAMDKVKT